MNWQDTAVMSDPAILEPELRQVLKGCKSKAEADRVVAAYMREAKGRDNLNDRILLARKRKETGASKPVRKIPEPSKPPSPEVVKTPPKPQRKASPVRYQSPPPKIVEKPKSPEPPKPPPRSLSPTDSEFSDSEKEEKKAYSPPPKKPEPLRETKQPVQETSKQAEIEKENIPQDQPATTKQKGAKSKPASKKGLFDYYSKGVESKQSLTKSKPTLQYAARNEPKSPVIPITPPPKGKRKKKKSKKKVSGFSDFSSSDSESDTLINKQNKTADKKKPVLSSSSDSDSNDDKHDMPNTTKKQPVSKPSLTKPIKPVRNDIPSSSDESTEEEKEKVVKKLSSTESDSDDEPPKAQKATKAETKRIVQSDSDSDTTINVAAENQSKKTSLVKNAVAEVSETAATTTAATSEVAATDVTEHKKEKAVRWDSDVTSPKPTQRKPKRNKKNKKKKILEILKEEEEDEVKAVTEDPVALSEEKVSTPPKSPIVSRPTSAKSDASSQVEHVRDDPALTGPLFPSTLSLQSRHSQQVAQAELLPSAVEQQDELQQQLSAIDAPAAEINPGPVITDPEVKPTKAAEKQSKKPEKRPERDLSPYQILPDIPSTNKKTEWPSISKLQGKTKQKTDDSLIIYAKPHKKGGKKKREKKDFTPYLDALDKACDSSLQYVVAKTGAKLGVDQQASVVRARMAIMMNEKKTAKLDQKILGRLQNENGAYKKRIDKFLSKP